MGGAGEIWGISDPGFLLAYLAIAVAVWMAGTRARRAIADTGTDRPAGDLAAHPHDVAHLNAGPSLAVYSALSAMHLTGTIVTDGRGSVQAAGRLAPGAEPLERAIHVTAAAPVSRQRLRFHRPVGTALHDIEDRLVAAGLLLSPARRRRIRAVGWWMVAVGGLGLVRLLAGIAVARPDGFLLAALVAVALVAVVHLTRSGRRSRAGNELLDELRREHRTMAPEGDALGPVGAALGVGLFGLRALWASDPDFADDLAAHPAAAR